jgi:predicted metal-dependent peptidase/uncharacterized membrane protein YoaK (UPF0700 family)
MTELPGLAAARLWATTRFPYLATGLFGAEVLAEPGSGTVSVDQRWRMHADPELTATWSAAQLGSVLVHHVCHLLRAHAERALLTGVSADDSAVWVRAADAEINDDLIPAGLELPGDPVRPADFGAPDGKLAEEYFRGLVSASPGGTFLPGGMTPPGPPGTGGPVPPYPPVGASAPHPPRPPAPSSGSWLDCGSGADGQPGDGEGGLDQWQADLLRRQVAQDVTRAGKEPGKVPAGLLRWAREILSPRVDWRRLLAAELRRAIADVAGAVDYSYQRPSRRAVAVPAVVLPALRRPVPEVAVVCDTSGSMTEDLLAMALAEVEGLLRGLGLARHLRVLACDTAAGRAQRVSSAKQVTLVGGGGTNMGAGIAAARALRPRPAVCVVLTDGYTPWPAAAPKGMRVIAGLLGDDAPEGPWWARCVRVALRIMNSASGLTRPSPRALSVMAVLLTFASGASDVNSFTRLGGVFTSVMTGNIAVFGLSVARGSLSLAAHIAVAFGGYVAGVAAGTRISWHHAEHGAREPGEEWPPHLTLTLLTEAVLFAGVVAGWEVTGSRPTGAAQFIILAMAACGMGLQSAAVSQMGLGNVSTTYLTGTLTGLVTAIASPGRSRASVGLRRPGVLAGLLAGATLAGLCIAYAGAVAPLLSLLAVTSAVTLEIRGKRRAQRAESHDHGAKGSP